MSAFSWLKSKVSGQRFCDRRVFTLRNIDPRSLLLVLLTSSYNGDVFCGQPDVVHIASKGGTSLTEKNLPFYVYYYRNIDGDFEYMDIKYFTLNFYFKAVKGNKLFQSLPILLGATFNIFTTGPNIDSSFKPVFSGGYGTVTSINQRADGKTVISGGFTIAGGERNNSVAVLNIDGSSDNSFDIGKGTANSTGGDAGIFQNAIQNDNKILIGGNFDRVDGIVRNRLARLNPDGSVDASFDVGQGFNSTVAVIKVLPNGKILVGGYFSTFNSQSVGALARLNPDGTLDSSFARLTSAFNVLDIAIQPDGRIILVGETVVRLNEDGTVD